MRASLSTSRTLLSPRDPTSRLQGVAYGRASVRSPVQNHAVARERRDVLNALPHPGDHAPDREARPIIKLMYAGQVSNRRRDRLGQVKESRLKNELWAIRP